MAQPPNPIPVDKIGSCPFVVWRNRDTREIVYSR